MLALLFFFILDYVGFTILCNTENAVFSVIYIIEKVSLCNIPLLVWPADGCSASIRLIESAFFSLTWRSSGVKLSISCNRNFCKNFYFTLKIKITYCIRNVSFRNDNLVRNSKKPINGCLTDLRPLTLRIQS